MNSSDRVETSLRLVANYQVTVLALSSNCLLAIRASLLKLRASPYHNPLSQVDPGVEMDGKSSRKLRAHFSSGDQIFAKGNARGDWEKLKELNLRP
jgi:hypothetical protein